ncbi:HrcA family transcriptional regulator [Marinitoga lauensis]|uniref:HrcA family transcriptional regulator n=1 Tax=Marinitoga lauensis TaxID=2201189 RepID=UPI0010136840|nr:HTH domain-containing protein [Marinitoga lauensis]
MPKELSNRQKKVLFSIIENFIKEKKPISSSEILKKSNLSVSSATIRNDMQKLQHLDLIFQPHSSAGRIPTDKALRLYFEAIKESFSVKSKNIELPQDYKFYDINIMFDKFSKMLSELTNSLVILELPDSRYIYITRAVVSDLTNDFYQITLMTNLGLSITRTVEKFGFPSPKELEKILNNGLIGKSMHEIINIIKSKSIEKEQDIRLMNLYNLVFLLAEEFFRNKFIVNGLAKVISSGYFNTKEIVFLSKVVEEDKMKVQLLSLKPFDIEIKTTIGNEFGINELRNFIMIETSYCHNANPLGKVALLTFKYSNYKRIYTILNEYTSRLSKIISKNL